MVGFRGEGHVVGWKQAPSPTWSHPNFLDFSEGFFSGEEINLVNHGFDLSQTKEEMRTLLIFSKSL